MSSKVRLIVCHQNRLFRECLVSALAAAGYLEILVMDGTSTAAFPPSRPDGIDLLLIDACLPEMAAFRLIQSLRVTDQAPRTILLGSSASPDLIAPCLRAGVDGCVLDEDTFDDFRQAIENVLVGRNYCSPQIARRLFTQTEGLVQLGNGSVRLPDCGLTPRQIEVLRMYATRNLGNKQIARELRLSVYTVKNHFHSIFEKLNVEDRQSAVRHAARQGLLDNPLA
jgi:two-component system NarL family response regulator